jgi:hypothetical protein
MPGATAAHSSGSSHAVPDTPSSHVAASASFPVLRLADLNDRAPDAWLGLAHEQLDELDRQLARKGWRRRGQHGPDWWSLAYDRAT